jgi:Family of unknown function (DUF6515)
MKEIPTGNAFGMTARKWIETGKAYVPRKFVIPDSDSCTTVYGGGQTFTYCNGVFYESTSNGYKITNPPPGVMVTSLPNGAAVVTVNGVDYREFGGLWYQPFYSGSEVIYQTVSNPTA